MLSSREQRDNSLSLRAQLDKVACGGVSGHEVWYLPGMCLRPVYVGSFQSEGLTPDQEEELQVLRQQQQMLRDLIEQQEKVCLFLHPLCISCLHLFPAQIKELEVKQAELLRRRGEAQKQLAEAEARVCVKQSLDLERQLHVIVPFCYLD